MVGADSKQAAKVHFAARAPKVLALLGLRPEYFKDTLHDSFAFVLPGQLRDL